MMTKTIDIEGMGCAMCVKKVKGVLECLAGVESAEVSLENNNAVVSLSADVADDILKSAVESKGFTVRGIV